LSLKILTDPRVFRKVYNGFDVWYIHIFLRYRNIWYTNENSLHGQFMW
jgi:hypothetical protein